MAKLVQAKINLNCLVTQKVEPKKPEGWIDDDQFHNIHKCVTDVISLGEWQWRFDTAVQILCSGSAYTSGSYYGDVIGGEQV